MFGSFGTQELIIVALIALLLFGSAKLPKLMRDMGRSIGEFKQGLQDKPKDGSLPRPEDKIESESKQDEHVGSA